MYVPELVDDEGEGDDEISRVLRENAASMREIAAADVSAQSDSGEGQQPPQAFDVAPDVGAAATRREIS